jgi:TetR/AcrR family transcriptional regulator
MPPVSPDAPKTRDAERSRRAILDAAEALFARRGFEAASLAEIGEAAGVSRGTPSYFFGTKEELYRAVLERMYADRTAVLEPVFAPLVAWAQARGDAAGPLRSVLAQSVEGYLRFLHDRPTYVDIIERESLAGGERLRSIGVESTVMEDAFGALRGRARARGLRAFDPGQAVITLVSLSYLPVAHRDTMVRRQGFAFDDPAFVAARKEHITDVMMNVLGAKA